MERSSNQSIDDPEKCLASRSRRVEEPSSKIAKKSPTQHSTAPPRPSGFATD